MHAKGIVTRVLGPCLAGVHVKRVAALSDAIAALLCGGVTSLSAIALYLHRETALKHRVKSIDRLLGNPALHRMRLEVYRQLAQRWLGSLEQWLIVVDWSDVTADQRWQLLRASVVVEGRSVTLYEEVHPRRKLGNPAVQRAFVERLRRIVPRGSHVIVMTDAGFHSPWFKLVEEQGWQFLGRIRGKNRLRLGENEAWVPARHWYRCAGEAACDLGGGHYARSNPVAVRAVLAPRVNKGRHRLTVQGHRRRSRTSLKHARAAREPWLLVSSRALGHLSAQSLIGLYAQRMRIEQSFRDTKNLRTGLGLDVSRSRSDRRFEMLLLIAHLASFAQRLIGESAKERQLELQFMIARRANRREISVLTLARRILDIAPQHLRALRPWRALTTLRTQAELAVTEVG
jgi:hypothetical protein